MIADNQMINAHDFIMGMVHAQLGLAPISDKPEYTEAFGLEYERLEKQDAYADDLPF